MTVLIIVGMDRTGKTPLVQLIKKGERRAVVKRIVDSPFDQDALSKAGLEVASWRGDDKRLLVYDRFPYPDEFVYGKNLRRVDFPYWEQRMRATDADIRFVYCEPNNLTAFQRRVADDPDVHFDMTDMEVITEHSGKYKTWLTQCTFPILRLSCDTMFDAERARRVVAWAEGIVR